MLRIDNRTPFATALVPALDERGAGYAFVVVKASYELASAGAPRLAEEQEAPWHADEYLGEPGRSSIRYPSDMMPPKPGTDVVLVGSAHARAAVDELEVSLRVGRLAKRVRVVGDRVYRRRLGVVSITSPEPFTTMPLVYERAFGGADGGELELRNHVGAGFVAAGQREIDGRPLPNLEDPDAPIRGPEDRPAPACFGCVSPSWMPRLGHAGTFDERWRAEQCPFLPLDFDRRFYHAAHPDLCTLRPLAGGEAVSVSHVLPGGRTLAFSLPEPALALSSMIKRRRHEARFALATVLIDASELRLFLSWTATIPCGREFLMIDSLRIEEAA